MAQRRNELQKYNRLLLRLGTSVEAVTSLPQISSYISSTLRLPRDRVLSYLRMSDHEDIRKWLSAYDSPLISTLLRDQLPYEVYCATSEVSPLRLLELLGGLIVRCGAQESVVIAAINHPRVVEKTVDFALTQEGESDRRALDKAVGFLPQPKGAQTTINLQANATAAAEAKAAQVISAPPPELTIRRLVDRFNDARGLKGDSPASTPTLCEENAHERIPDFPHEGEEPEPVTISAMSPVRNLARKMFEESQPEE